MGNAIRRLAGFAKQAVCGLRLTTRERSAYLIYQDTRQRLRQQRAEELGLALRGLADDRQKLDRWIAHPKAPWLDRTVTTCEIPGMLTHEEERYYHYFAQYYTGLGEIVEFGPWLGRSTYVLLDALTKGEKFSGHKLHVFDDFVWRPDWMDGYVQPARRLNRHASFQKMFQDNLSKYSDCISATRCKIVDYDGNEGLPQFSWTGGSVEIVIADCGRTILANEAWFTVLKEYFIPDVTLIVLQDFGTHKEWPRQWFNQLDQFVDKHANCLDCIHEVKDGGIATFVFRNNH